MKPPLMVLVENNGDRCVLGIRGDGEDSVTEGVYKESGFGDGVLHLVDGGDHLLGDLEILLGLGQGVHQGADDVGEAGKDMAIKITHPQQSLNIQLGRWHRELLDGRDLLREGADPLGVHRVTEECEGGFGQGTLLQVHGEAVLPEVSEHLPQVLLVLLDGAGTY